MKKLLFILSFLIAFNSYSQNNDGIEICLQYQKSLKSFISDKEAEDALNKILNVIGASRNFLLVSCDEISNALAITFKGERYILYDKDFIDKIEDMTNDWSGLFILAHEIGHHINGHTRDFLLAEVLDEQSKEKQREEELEADEFAGFIVANLGAKYNELSELLDLFDDYDDSYSTHPNKDKRKAAVKKGFDKYQPKVIVTTSNNNTNIVNERITNATSNAWISKTRYPLELNNRIEKDLFKIRENKQRFPIIQKESFTIGKMYKDSGIEDVKLNILQRKFTYKNANNLLTENDQKIRPYIDIEITLEGYLNMPEYIYGKRDYYEYPRDLIEIEYKEGSVTKIHYIIDDILSGFFVVQLDGWGQYSFRLGPINFEESGFENAFDKMIDDKKKFMENTIIKGFGSSLTGRDRLIKNKHDDSYEVLYPESIWINEYTKEYQYMNDEWAWEEHFHNQKNISDEIKFIDALKRGKKLYLKLDQDIWDPRKYKGKNVIYFWNEAPTMEFDLKGSSKALNFN